MFSKKRRGQYQPVAGRWTGSLLKYLLRVRSFCAERPGRALRPASQGLSDMLPQLQRSEASSHLSLQLSLCSPGVHISQDTWFSFLCVYVLSRVQLFATPWSGARQAPLSVGFSMQEYWSAQPFPSPWDLPTQGLNPGLLHCRKILYCLTHQGSPRNPQK